MSKRLRSLRIKGSPAGKLPVLLMTAVIIPGLIISILGIYLVSQQKSAGLLNIKKEYTNRLMGIRTAIETRVRQQVEQVFRQIDAHPVNLDEPEALPDQVKTIVLNNPVVKYPFFINSEKKFLFPLSKKTGFPAVTAAVPDEKILNQKAKELYIKGSHREYQERDFVRAIGSYLESLEEVPGAALKPYIYNSIARCYFKLNRFPQAVAYYRKALGLHTAPLSKDKLLYFTVLRQMALSYKQMGAEEQALKFYLLLYEKILNYDYDVGGKSPFAFFKNEALDYLNRRAWKDKPEETDRFSRAKAMDRLKEASELDISLRWLYFDAGTEKANPDIEADKDELRFLRLQELHEANDEKTRFYQALKRVGEWAPRGTAAAGVRQLKDPLSTGSFDIAFKPVVNDHPQREAVFFGFMLSLDFIKREIVSRAAGEQLDDPGLFVDVSASGKRTPGLLSIPFQSLLPGKNLTLYSRQDNFFETIVRRGIRLYYVLLTALILALVMGTFLFYKYLSREAELVKLKAEFVDRASHTLKTPLTRMSLLAENMAQGWVTEESKKKDFFDTVVSETARMSEMIDNMLNFSRIEAGKQQYEPEETYLQEIVAAMIRQYSGYIENLGFQLSVDIDDRLPGLFLDKKAVKLIIANLLQNAVKYSLEGKYIRIRVYRQQESAVFEIEDRGIGISTKDLPYIFKKFSRVPDKRVKSIEGSGLGLFLVHHAVVAHQGRVNVRSTPGEGSTFRVCFPFARKSRNLDGKNKIEKDP